MSSTDRVKALRERRKAQGLVEFQMTIKPDEHQACEEFRRLLMEARGEVFQPREWTGRWHIWLDPEEAKFANEFRDNILAGRREQARAQARADRASV